MNPSSNLLSSFKIEISGSWKSFGRLPLDQEQNATFLSAIGFDIPTPRCGDGFSSDPVKAVLMLTLNGFDLGIRVIAFAKPKANAVVGNNEKFPETAVSLKKENGRLLNNPFLEAMSPNK